MKIPWENSISVWMCSSYFFPLLEQITTLFFLFNKYTYIIYTYELHLKLFNKITTLKKPHAFPRESRKTDRPRSHTPEILPDTQDRPKSQNKENSRRWATCGKPLIRHFFLCVLTPAKASTGNVNISQSRTKPALTARGHLTAPANHSTAQAKEETPLKIKTIKHLGWRVQMIWDLKERKKRNQFYRNSNRRMAGSHPWLPSEDIYWDTETAHQKKLFDFLLPKKEDRSSFPPQGLAISHPCCDGMAHTTHTVRGHCPGSCISRPRSEGT